MFAVRRLAPRALRMPLATQMVAMNNVSRRLFNSNFEQVSRGAQKLAKALDKEIKYENDNYTQLEDIENFLNESGFTFTEADHSQEMYLTKTVADKKIMVAFEARQPTPDDEEAGEDQPEDEEEQGLSENYVDFTIAVTDGSGKSGLIVEATSMDTEINYSSVMVSSDVSAHMKLHRFERQMKTYPGPDFSTLDERIQSSMTEYLEGFGVNEQLCSFVECMSLDKDQRLYMRWLTQVKDFIQE